MRCVRFKGAMKIDVWRILIVYKYGGIYSDIDHYPGSKLSETDPIQPDDEAFFLSDAWGRPSQWWFAMEPKVRGEFDTSSESIRVSYERTTN